MIKDTPLTFPDLLKSSVSRFAERPAYAFVGEKALTYKEVSDTSKAVTFMLEQLGIVPGDKVGLFSSNMPNWGITFFAITSMGAVVVPMLPDFSNVEVNNVIEHSEMKAMFVSKSLFSKISNSKDNNLKHIIDIEDFNLNISNSKVNLILKWFLQKHMILKKLIWHPSFILPEQQVSQKVLCFLIKTFALMQVVAALYSLLMIRTDSYRYYPYPIHMKTLWG